MPAASRILSSRLHESWPWIRTTAGPGARVSAGTYQALISIPGSRLANRTSSYCAIRYGVVSRPGDVNAAGVFVCQRPPQSAAVSEIAS